MTTYFTPAIEEALSRWIKALSPPQAAIPAIRAKCQRLKMTPEQIDQNAALLTTEEKVAARQRDILAKLMREHSAKAKGKGCSTKQLLGLCRISYLQALREEGL